MITYGVNYGGGSIGAGITHHAGMELPLQLLGAIDCAPRAWPSSPVIAARRGAAWWWARLRAACLNA